MTKPLDYAITFACYNQVEYTRQCLDSMMKHDTDLNRVIVVDNCSTDNTREYLDTLPLGGRIFNKINLGCGVAWNQGALALQAEWTIVMNNDVLVCANWIENLIYTAEKNGLKIISPAMIEGQLDYDFDAFADEAKMEMKDVLRRDDFHAVCFAVHKSVWLDVGYFQAVPKLLGYEDSLFFSEVKRANIPTGITGNCWLHHYGSMTQTAMKREQGLNQKQGLGNRHIYLRLLQQNWLTRKLHRRTRNTQQKMFCEQEINQHGMSLFGTRVNADFIWR